MKKCLPFVIIMSILFFVFIIPSSALAVDPGLYSGASGGMPFVQCMDNAGNYFCVIAVNSSSTFYILSSDHSLHCSGAYYFYSYNAPSGNWSSGTVLQSTSIICYMSGSFAVYYSNVTINDNTTSSVYYQSYDMDGAKGCQCSTFDSSWFQKWYDKECLNFTTTWNLDQLTVERLPQLAYWTRNNDGSVTGVIDFFFNMTSIPSRMYYGLDSSRNIIIVYASPIDGQNWTTLQYPFNTKTIIYQDKFVLKSTNTATHTITTNSMFDGTNYKNLSIFNAGQVSKDNFHYYFSAPFHQLMWFTAIANQNDFTSSANINSYSPTQSTQTPENNSNPNNITSQESTWASQTSAANAITFSISDPSTWLNPVYAALQWMVNSQPVQALESFIQLSIGWLPPEITTIITLGVLLCVILRVLGR